MSTLENSVSVAAHSAELNWYKDGLENIYRGFLLVLLSVDSLVPTSRQGSSLYVAVAPFLGLCGLLLFGVLTLAHRSLIEWLKAKVTLPRIGYVPPPPSAVGVDRYDNGFWPVPLPTLREEEYLVRQQKMRLWTYAFVILLVVLGLSRFSGPLMDDVVVLIWALFFGLASKYTQPPGRSAWAALILCLLSGISAIWLSFPGTRPTHVLFPLLGGISTAIGACQFTVFLLRHPRQAPTES